MICDREQLLTYKDIQTILKVGKNRAYELLKSECFPTIRINHRMYVSPDALQKWIDTYSGKKFFV